MGVPIFLVNIGRGPHIQKYGDRGPHIPLTLDLVGGTQRHSRGVTSLISPDTERDVTKFSSFQILAV